jgi:hypothetical protein
VEMGHRGPSPRYCHPWHPPDFSGGILDRRHCRMFFPSPISHIELPTSNFLRPASCGTALRWLRAIAALFAIEASVCLITHNSTLTPVLIGSMTRRWRLSDRSKPSYRRVQSGDLAKVVCKSGVSPRSFCTAGSIGSMTRRLRLSDEWKPYLAAFKRGIWNAFGAAVS